MQTPANTERYLVTMRGSKMAIRLGECRVFDTESDAMEHIHKLPAGEQYWSRLFRVWNDKRPKEINWQKT